MGHSLQTQQLNCSTHLKFIFLVSGDKSQKLATQVVNSDVPGVPFVQGLAYEHQTVTTLQLPNPLLQG